MRWSGILELFSKSQIQAIGPQTPIDYQRHHRTIYDWIHGCVKFLQPDDREGYLLCSGFRDDIEIGERLFQTFWKDRGGNRWRSWLGVLRNTCLLNWNNGIVLFYDLHLDYLRYRAEP